jgi:hypothetical protein
MRPLFQGRSAEIPPFIVRHFRHAVTHFTTFSLPTLLCCNFRVFWLLFVYINLVRLFVTYIYIHFCLPPWGTASRALM